MPAQDDSGREGGPDLSTAAITDLDDRLEPLESVNPSEIPLSEGTVPGFNGATAALVAGGVFSVWAVRALANRRLRALPYGILGVALLVRGLSGRAGEFEQFSADRLEGDDVDPGDGDTDEGTVGVDDEVATDPRTTEDGVDVDRSAEPSADEETEPASAPGPEESVDDPPSANEASEATGPKPQQAEPTQTDATEPEATPSEDASAADDEPDIDAASVEESTADADSFEADSDDEANESVDDD